MLRNRRKERIGKVSSHKGNKTITVLIENIKEHPLYKKRLRQTKKLMAHDENNESSEGDTVKIMETRPLSKNKRWRLVKVLEKAR